MSAETLALSRFCSDALPEATRLATVREFYADLSMAIDLQPLCAPQQFRLDLSTLALDEGCGLGGGHLSPYLGRRDRLQASRHGSEGLLLTRFTTPFTFSGGALDHQHFAAGDVLVAPLDQAFTYIYQQPGQIQTIWMDRRRLSELLPRLDAAPRRLPAGGADTNLLFGYAQLLTAQALPRSMSGLAARHVLDLMAQALDSHGTTAETTAEATAGGRHAALLAALRQDILRGYRQPQLSVAELAARRHISVRLLQQLFEQAGTTFTAELQACRLAHVQRLLADPRHRHMPVAHIALDAGFGDLAAFNRLFRRRLGATPTELRRAALARTGPG